jgi:drug/metabolite transporter (DMT)-like permease
MGIIFALSASFILALSQVVLKKSFSQISPSITFFFNTVLSLFLWIPLAFFLGVTSVGLFKAVFISFLSAVFSEAFFFYVLSKGQLCITGTILATYPIYTLLFSVLINHEMLKVSQYIFIIITIIGTILVSLPRRLESRELREFSKIGWALCGAISTGLADSMAKSAVDSSSAGTFLLCLALTQVPVSFAFIKFENGSFSQIQTVLANFRSYLLSIIGSSLNVFGVMFLVLALQSTLASIASPITATNTVIMVILASIFLKEPITCIGLLGVISAVVGVIGISI